MKDLSPLEAQLNITFTNKELLQQAFIHRSYINEHSGTGLSHNERIEFLGDAVMELIVTDEPGIGASVDPSFLQTLESTTI